MLHRAHQEGTIIIGQPAHARMVGVVARAWGQPPFWMPPHSDETFLAAEQHEIGMLPWEITPTLNPWPLTVGAVRLVGEGRLLRDRYRDETAMREGLIRAPWVRWESIIAPAR
ncbi:MAG: DUF3891 family protein [Thermomicrobiales bacterium]